MLKSKEITFIFKMQNAAKGVVSALGGDFKGLAQSAAKASEDVKKAARAAEDMGRSIAKAGNEVVEAGKKAQNADFKGSFDKGSGAATGLLGKVTLLRGAFAAFIAAAGVGGIAGEYINFENKIAEFSAVTNTSGEALDSVRQKAQEMVTGTIYSATQAAAAMTIFARAGASTADAMTAAKSTIDGATVAGLDMDSMAQIVISSLNQFGQSANRAADFVDILAKVDNISAADMRGLGEALNYSGTIANTAGVSFNTLAGALGVLGDAGTKGSRAGTELQAVISSMLLQTPRATKAINDLGLSVSDLNPQDIVGTFRKLRDAGLTTADALVIFGEQGGRAASVLANNVDKLQNFTEATERAGGTAAKAAEIMSSTLGGDLAKAKQSIIGLAVAIGEGGLGQALRVVIQAVATVVTGLTAFVQWVSGSSTAAETLRSILAGLAVAIAAVYVGSLIAATNFGLFGTAVGVAALEVKAFTLALLANPITLWITAITAAVAAIVYFGNKTYEVNGTLVSGWDVVTAAFAAAAAFIQSIWDQITKFCSDGVSFVVEALSSGMTDVLSTVQGYWEQISSVFRDVWGVIGPYVKAGLRIVLAAMTFGLSEVVIIVFGKWDAIRDAFSRNWNTIADQAKRAMRILLGIITLGLSEVAIAVANSDVVKRAGAAAVGAFGASVKGSAAKPANARIAAGTATVIAPTVPKVRAPSLSSGGSSGSGSKASGTGRTGQSEAEKQAQEIERLMKSLLPATARTKEYQDQLALLKSQLGKGGPEAAKYALAIDVLKDRYESSKDSLSKLMESLSQEEQLLKVSASQRDTASKIMQLENQLRAEGLAYVDNGIVKITKEAQARYQLAVATIKQNDVLRDQERLNTQIADRAAATAVDLSAANLFGYQKERYIAWWREYNAKLKEFSGDSSLAKIAAEDLAASMDKLNAVREAARGNIVQGAREGLASWIEDASNFADQTAGIVSNMANNLTDAITQFALTGKLSFKNFVQSAIKDISALIAKMLVLRAIKSVLPGGGVGLFHSGGLVGMPGPTMTINPMVFAAAQRYHSGGMVGLKPDEVPIIAKMGERVLNPEQTRAYNAGLVGGGLSASRGPSSGGGTISLQSNTTLNLGDQGGSSGGGPMDENRAGMLQKMLDEEIKKAMLRFVEKEKRTGGILSKNGNRK